jgi:26S proteasome regulatory subunit N3
VVQFDSRFTLRAIRLISTLRKRLDDVTICEVIALTYPPGHRTASVLIKATGIDGDAFQKILKNVGEGATNGGAQIAKNEVIPEIDIYLAILIQVGFGLRCTLCRS